MPRPTARTRWMACPALRNFPFGRRTNRAANPVDQRTAAIASCCVSRRIAPTRRRNNSQVRDWSTIHHVRSEERRLTVPVHRFPAMRHRQPVGAPGWRWPWTGSSRLPALSQRRPSTNLLMPIRRKSKGLSISLLLNEEIANVWLIDWLTD